jgi:hypothetical protein
MVLLVLSDDTDPEGEGDVLSDSEAGHSSYVDTTRQVRAGLDSFRRFKRVAVLVCHY